jgi:hypothetical protein
MDLRYDRLVIDQEPVHVLFVSEAYPVLLRMGYLVAADVSLRISSRKVERSIIVSSYSLANNLRHRIIENNKMLSGVQVWIYKSGSDRKSSYVVED